MTTYDDAALQHLADRLHGHAAVSVRVWMALGGAAGAALGVPLGVLARGGVDPQGVASAVALGLVVGVLLGIPLGRARAEQLRLAAQIALCQRQIELNTRAHRGASAVRAVAEDARASA